MKRLVPALSQMVMVLMLLAGCGGGGGGTLPGGATTDKTAPTAPTNLTATAAGTAQINLSWTASTDNIGVAGYEVWRGSTKITTVTTTSYSDTGLTASTAYTYTVKAFDGAANVSGASNAAIATTTAVGGGSSLRVRFVGNSKATVPNATVVLGDSNGVMIATGTTDVNGEYTFNNPPANATVTTARSCVYASGGTSKIITVIYDVNVPAVSLTVCDIALTALGTITVNVTNTLGTVTQNKVYIGGDSYWVGSLITQQTYTVYQNHLQSDGKISIVVLGSDSNGKPVGYGALLDQTFVNGMSVDITVNQPMSYVQYQLTNIPNTGTDIGDLISLWKKNTGVGFSDYLTSTATSTTINVPYLPGFADEIRYDAYVYLDQNSNGLTDAMFWSTIFGVTAAPSNQSFDFSQMPVIPSNPVVSYGTGTATPTFSWSGIDANSVVTFGSAYTINSDSGEINLHFNVSPTRTSIVFPQLPDALAAFRPAGFGNFDVSNITYSCFSGYADYLTKMDQYVSGTWSIPSSSTGKQSSQFYSSTQNLKPALNKTTAPAVRVPKRILGIM